MRTSLLDNLDGETVMIRGHEVSTEEAALEWQAMATAERAIYLGKTDLEIVEAIYRERFGYLQ